MRIWIGFQAYWFDGYQKLDSCVLSFYRLKKCISYIISILQRVGTEYKRERFKNDLPNSFIHFALLEASKMLRHQWRQN
jgi:hypothetical protein